MKIRLSIWVLIAVAVAVVTLALWHHRPAAPLGPTVEKQNAPSSTSGTPAVSTPTTANFAPLTAAANPHQPPPSAIQVILDEQAPDAKREAALHGLAGKLTDLDREALYTFLKEHVPGDDGQLGQVLKNALLDKLCQMEPPPAGLLDLLTQIFQDAGQNIVLRDYAVQHLAAFYRQMASAPGVDSQTSSDELSQARQVLWAAVNETDSSISGSAMLGLTQLAQQGWSGIDTQRLSDAALKLASDNSASELTRITAFQVCASLDVTNALPYILGAAQQGETVPVQISAVGALGILGGPAQAPLLNSLLQGKDDRLKLPAKRALEQIAQRQERGE